MLRAAMQSRLDAPAVFWNPFSDYDHEEFEQNEKSTSEINGLLQRVVVALQSETASLRERKNRLPGGRGRPDVWRISYAMTLGFAFFYLTGSEPSLSAGDASFCRFVECAYESIGGIEMSWESQIRTAIDRMKRRPRKNRWDFLEFIRQEPVDHQEIARWIHGDDSVGAARVPMIKKPGLT